MKIFTIKDTKAGVYNSPFYARTHGEAERNFQSLARDEKSMVAQYPEDYDLYFLGEWDEVEGAMSIEDAPQHVLKAASFLTDKQ